MYSRLCSLNAHQSQLVVGFYLNLEERESDMTIEEFRNKVEGNCDISPGLIGYAIIEALKTSRSNEEYECMLDIVGKKLIGHTSDTVNLLKRLAECHTLKDMDYFLADLDFSRYNKRGIPIHKMVTKRITEIVEETKGKKGFLARIFGS